MSRHVQVRRPRFSSSSSWSELPPELLETIADRLNPNPNSDDLHFFRSVCKRWSSAVSPPPLTLSPVLPHEIPPLKSYPPDFHSRPELPFVIVPTAIHLLRRRPSASSTASAAAADGGGGCLVAVEQSHPGKLRLFHPFTKLSLPSDHNCEICNLKFPKNPCNWSSIEISRGFHLTLPDRLVTPGMLPTFQYSKVLFWPCPYRRNPGIENSSLMVLSHDGYLTCLRLNSSNISAIVTSGQVSRFDDIVIRRGMVMAVDRLGRLYQIEYKRMIATVVVIAVPLFTGSGERRKRVFWDAETCRMYLVVREHGVKEGTKFMVYAHNSREGVWEKLQSLGKRVLFVSFDTCFFVPAADLGGFQGNCIVFPKDCFPAYSGTNNPDGSLFGKGEVVGVYKYGEGVNFKLISDCPGYSDALWPPPQWIWEDTPKSSFVESAEYVEEISSELQEEKSQADEMKAEFCSQMTEQQQSPMEDRGTTACSLGPVTTPREMQNDSIQRASDTFLNQILGINVSRVPFEGVNIRSDLAPTLEKIWAKHGNLIGGSAIRNGDIIANALESLAMIVQLLHNSSGKTLERHQVDYISSALRDLQFMRFSVDWLLPSVDKALAVQKGSPLLDSLRRSTRLKLK